MRYKITLSYDGTPFSGWQIQPNAPSIQESLQRVLGILLKEEIAVTAGPMRGYMPSGMSPISTGRKVLTPPLSATN